jgi:hypothetical protein
MRCGGDMRTCDLQFIFECIGIASAKEKEPPPCGFHERSRVHI